MNMCFFFNICLTIICTLQANTVKSVLEFTLNKKIPTFCGWFEMVCLLSILFLQIKIGVHTSSIYKNYCVQNFDQWKNQFHFRFCYFLVSVGQPSDTIVLVFIYILILDIFNQYA